LDKYKYTDILGGKQGNWIKTIGIGIYAQYGDINKANINYSLLAF
jgi:hypothetical protein